MSQKTPLPLVMKECLPCCCLAVEVLFVVRIYSTTCCVAIGMAQTTQKTPLAIPCLWCVHIFWELPRSGSARHNINFKFPSYVSVYLVPVGMEFHCLMSWANTNKLLASWNFNKFSNNCNGISCVLVGNFLCSCLNMREIICFNILTLFSYFKLHSYLM